MKNTNKFIGIPYAFNKSSFDSADCLGLCKLFYREHNWSETFDDGKEITQEWYKKEPYRLLRYLVKNFDKTKDINKLSYGDIIYFNVDSEGHIGIYIGYGKFISTYPGNPKSPFPQINKSFIDRIQNWIPFFVCGFHKRGD